MIKGYHKNNLSEYKKLCAFHLFYARGIHAFAYPILFFIVAGVFLTVAIVLNNNVCYVGAVILFALAVILPFITLAMQNAQIEKRLRQNPNYEKTEQFFEFDETLFRLKIRVGSREEDYEIPYAQVLRVYERRQLFYIYIGGSQILILNKADIENEKIDELADYFHALGKRFKEKKKYRTKSADGFRSEQ